MQQTALRNQAKDGKDMERLVLFRGAPLLSWPSAWIVQQRAAAARSISSFDPDSVDHWDTVCTEMKVCILVLETS